MSSGAMMPSVGPVMGLEDPRIRIPTHDLIGSFDLIAQLAPLIAEHQGNGTMSAVLLRGPNDPPRRSIWGITRWKSGFIASPMFGGHHRPNPRPPPRPFSLRPDRTSILRLAAA